MEQARLVQILVGKADIQFLILLVGGQRPGLAQVKGSNSTWELHLGFAKEAGVS